ncbi:MAG: hypothetical protein ABJF23_18725 [Bryobacteraceae bacterium]
MSLHLDLQEGFAHDSVVVVVNAKEVYRKPDVSTNISASVADTFEVNPSSEQAQIDVQILTRHTANSTTVNATEFPYVGISLDGEGKPVFKPSKQGFRYM